MLTVAATESPLRRVKIGSPTVQVWHNFKPATAAVAQSACQDARMSFAVFVSEVVSQVARREPTWDDWVLRVMVERQELGVGAPRRICSFRFTVNILDMQTPYCSDLCILRHCRRKTRADLARVDGQPRDR